MAATRPSAELTGRVAIVTGAGAKGDGIGNGRAAALLLAQAGASVLAVDRELDRAERTAEMIRDEGGSALAQYADVTQTDDCASMVATCLSEWGRLDILINNVGIGSRGSVVTQELDEWQHVMNVNLMSMVVASRHAIPAMIETSDAAAIVNISSISTMLPRGLTAYSTSKGAVIALTQAMAVDHGREGIRVNCVAPGPVRTPMVGGDDMPDHVAENRRRASLLGIEGTGWDVGAAVKFLVSDEARYVTGQTLQVDGGTTLHGPSRETGN